MSSSNGKYVVFKRSDWELHKSQPGCMPESLAVEDAVVIRCQDVFAPPALDAYANAISVALELDAACTTEPNPRATQLRAIADYFHEQAVLSWDTDRKLPD